MFGSKKFLMLLRAEAEQVKNSQKIQLLIRMVRFQKGANENGNYQNKQKN
jgi:hypothetical protein